MNKILYPTKANDEISALLNSLDVAELILLLSWFRDNQYRVSTVSINNWKRLNNIP